MIKIHYDFTDGSEISYAEGLEKKDNFNTCCLDFFETYNEADEILILKKNGDYISRNELINNIGNYTEKEIHLAHNILKMLKANSFYWREDKKKLSQEV